MKCPECGKELRKGFVEARNAGSLTNSLTMVTWYSEENRGKLLKKHPVSLPIDGEGWYCCDCMKVFAVFEQKSL